MIQIAKGLSLPLSLVTGRQVVVAKSRVGKSYVSDVMVEDMLEHDQQVVILDPTGAHSGLRTSADGASPGYSIAIVGGKHGDTPLELDSGEKWAEAVCADRFSAIFDLSDLDELDWAKWAAPFLRALFRRVDHPMHLVLDEADAFAPQNAQDKDQQLALRAVNSIVRRGGIKGLGCTLISQRAQLLNKNLLAQVEQLVVLQMHQKHDLKAVRDWVEAHDVDDQADGMLASLPSLPIGEAWIWSPAAELFRRVKVRRKRTFDSGRTPDVGVDVDAPKVLAPIDVKKLGTAIAAAAARAEANDPKALRKRVADLEVELRRMTELRDLSDRRRIDELPPNALDEFNMRTLRELVDAARDVAGESALLHRRIANLLNELRDVPKATPATNGQPAIVAPTEHQQRELDDLRKFEALERIVDAACIEADRDVLVGIATLSSLDIGVSIASLAAWSGVHPKNKTFLARIGALREGGLIEGLSLTTKGRAMAAPSRPNELELQAILSAGLSEQQRLILDTLATFRREQRTPTIARLALWLAVHPKNKSFLEDLGKLRDRGHLNGLSLTELGAFASRPLQSRGRGELLDQFANGQRAILEVAITKAPASITALAEALSLHPKNKALLEDIGKLRDRGLVAKGWPLTTTDVFNAGAS